jgi:hypothetical protein
MDPFLTVERNVMKADINEVTPAPKNTSLSIAKSLLDFKEATNKTNEIAKIGKTIKAL